MASEKKMIFTWSGYINLYTIDDHSASALDVAKHIQDRVAKLESEGWSDLVLRGDYDGDHWNVKLMGNKMEDDDEYENRMRKESRWLKWQEDKDKKEREQYERLRKKYGEPESRNDI